MMLDLSAVNLAGESLLYISKSCLICNVYNAEPDTNDA
jgi:hypothetical protein